jgi:hypothetical protein
MTLVTDQSAFTRLKKSAKVPGFGMWGALLVGSIITRYRCRATVDRSHILLSIQTKDIDDPRSHL